jgi:hypothetical protein
MYAIAITQGTYFLVVLSDFGIILLHGLSASKTRAMEAMNDYTHATSVSSESGVILHLLAEL